MTKKQKRIAYRIIISFILAVTFAVIPLSEVLKLILFLIPFLLIGYDILYGAIRGIIYFQPFDENFLMSVATIGAFLLGEYTEGVFVMLFYQLGELFQSYAVGKSRKSISSLMDIRPDYVNIKNENDDFEKVDPYEIAVGDYIFVKPGEKIALDGTIVEGRSFLDTVALTGESVPREVNIDDDVLSGSINLSGLLKIRVTKEFDESTASKILELVENSSINKSSSEKFITKFARIYTPAVCILSLLLAIVPPIVLFIANGEVLFKEWIYRALTFLVISCPCALVVSVPLSFFASIGGASRKGILIKGANYLEMLSKAKYILLDKTGTLTEGVFVVDEIITQKTDKETLLMYASYAEIFSNHPISESLRKSYTKPLDKSRVSCFTEISGFGVSAIVDNKNVLVGNSKLMEKNKIEYTKLQNYGTLLYVSVDNEYMGCIVISDRIKENTKEALLSLKNNGIKKCIMLTGDKDEVAQFVAECVGVDEYRAQMLPEDKVNFVESVLAECKSSEKVVFIGDGMNDAPVLARADIGVAMGALGSDAAIEAADVVITDDKITKIAQAIKISKKCMSIVYQNIYISIGVKLLVLLLGAFGVANMWFAIFADVGIMFLAVLNSIRAIKV